MGRVYAAAHTRLGRRFAVKLLFGDLAVQPNMRTRFAREAETASLLEHPNLVSVVDFGETEGGQLFIVMEYLEGLTLERIIAKHGGLPQDRIVRLGRDVARGLRHAHERGLVHRDLKPENVVVVADQDGEVPKIVDFGVAIVADDTSARMTRTGAVVGTPAFMSPEQALGEKVDHRSDLYSFGMLMYHLAAGRGPFLGSAGEILRQVVADTVPPIASFAPQSKVSPQLEALIVRLLSKHPGDRYQNAQEVIHVLDDLRLQDGPTQRLPLNRAERDTVVIPPATETVKRASPVVEPQERLSPLWALAAVLLLMTALTLGGLLWGRRGPTPPEPAEVTVESLAPPAPKPEAPKQRPSAPKRRAPLLRPKPSPSKPAPQVKAKLTPPQPAPAKAAPPPVSPPPVSPPPKAARRVAPAQPDAAPSTADFMKRYEQLGQRIETLAKTKGKEVAEPFQKRYLGLPFSAALRNSALRTKVVSALEALDKDVGDAL